MPVKLFHKSYTNPDSQQNLIVLHGLFGMLDNWHKIAKALSEDVNVHCVDLRNHGQSPHSPEMSLELMAEDVNTFIEDHNLKNICLLGHSMGGKVAMAFADQHPGVLDKLIVVDIAPKTYQRGHDIYFKAFNELDFSSFENRKEADDALAEREPIPAIRQFLLKNLDRNPNGGYQLKINVQAIEQFYPDLIQALDFQWIIDVPTLFIRGARSAYITDEDQLNIQETFTQASFVSIPNAGHWVHADQPQAFVQEVRKFIVD